MKLLSLLPALAGFCSPGAASSENFPGFPYGGIVRNKTKHFINIELPVDQVWFACVDSEKDSSWMNVYAWDGSNLYDFFYRRPWTLKMCRDEETLYWNMLVLTKAKTVRIVGERYDYEALPRGEHNPRVPRRFFKASNRYFGMITYTQMGDLCRGYFDEDCGRLPDFWVAQDEQSRVCRGMNDSRDAVVPEWFFLRQSKAGDSGAGEALHRFWTPDRAPARI